MNSSISMPTNTWKPWKPVSMKKVEPKTPELSFRFRSL